MPKITPFLWFDGKAEEAMNFYISIFKNSKVGRVTRYGEGGPGPKGTVMSATFQLEGQEFMALNGGPQFMFTPAISFFVNCETQQEVDELWEKLSEGGKKDRCGWLKDKYSLSWQIIPSALGKMLGDKDPEKSSFRRCCNEPTQLIVILPPPGIQVRVSVPRPNEKAALGRPFCAWREPKPVPAN